MREVAQRVVHAFARALPTVVLAAGLCAGGPAPAATPIADTDPTSLPVFSGTTAAAQRVRARRPPRHPWLARNGGGNVHDDAWMSDAYWVKGPLGRAPEAFSTAITRVCITITFDRKGRLVATCSNYTGAHLFMFDPDTLDTLAELPLPYVPPPAGQDPTTNSTGGAYFFLDNHDRAVIATADRHIWVVGEIDSGGVPGFAVQQDFDLSALMGDDRITSVLPDWQGRLWFVGRYGGRVGVLDPTSGHVDSMVLNEEIENSFAVDRKGVYIVSDQRMYRFGRDDTGTPTVVWSAPYDNSGIAKVGQFNAGSGTTPTLLRGGYVAIADNADPMQVVVYRTAETLAPGQSRVVCTVPVFAAGAGADENSLIGIGDSLIVENNFGYHFSTTIGGTLTAPGMTRIDVADDGCQVVWQNTTERIPSVVSKMSARTGLIYTFTKDADSMYPTSDVWVWTAIDFRTGAVAWKRLAGTGLLHNNHYAGIVLSRTGTAYVGAVGGVLGLRDTR